MQFVFTKLAGKYDRLDVFQGERLLDRIENPKQGIIPHDMFHFAVEQTLQSRGFLRRTLDGERQGWQMAPTPQSDGVERLVEVLQADGWSGSRASAAEIIDLYRVTCEARECPPLAIDMTDVDAVRDYIGALSERWHGVAVGDSLSLSFDS